MLLHSLFHASLRAMYQAWCSSCSCVHKVYPWWTITWTGTPPCWALSFHSTFFHNTSQAFSTTGWKIKFKMFSTCSVEEAERITYEALKFCFATVKQKGNWIILSFLVSLLILWCSRKVSYDKNLILSKITVEIRKNKAYEI